MSATTFLESHLGLGILASIDFVSSTSLFETDAFENSDMMPPRNATSMNNIIGSDDALWRRSQCTQP